jgi:hypothetical protein
MGTMNFNRSLYPVIVPDVRLLILAPFRSDLFRSVGNIWVEIRR